ncbi:oligosaccharide flippase family protein [Clostridium aestuarii]|uniref:Oligosaccharide flippase family protein n=1 Tax=Clostridium aestuarii TaxID=338193 RepID=A0ABT4CZG7_9CLOT|nr:oligosaccharide flippase family protein [Clostridium aestuarii]MCY6484382.1 oligosaccharide flippase family protein [Clostridium aestuarii]
MDKKLKKNIIYNGLYQIFIVLLPIITIPYISRIFNRTSIGIYGYTCSITNIFIYISYFGIESYGSREIAFVKSSKDKRNQTFWELWIMQFIMTIVSSGLFIIVNYFLFYKYFNTLMLWQIMICFSFTQVSWFFIGIEEFDKVVLRNTILRSSLTVLIFIFIKEEHQLNRYVFLNVLVYLVGNLGLLFSLKKYILKPIFKMSNVIIHLKKSLWFFIPSITTVLFVSLDKTLLGIFSNIENVAFYEQSQKILNIAVGLINSVGMVLLPRMSFYISENKMEEFIKMFNISLKACITVGFYFVAGIISVSPLFSSWFFGRNFEGVGFYMQILAVIAFTRPLRGILTNALFIPLKQERFVVKLSNIILIFMITGNVLLDTHFGIYGAIISLLTVELISTWYLFYKMTIQLPELNMKEIINYLLINLGASIITVTIVLIMSNYLRKSIITTVILGIIATIIFLIVSLLLKNEIVWNYVYKMNIFLNNKLKQRG